jgi:aminopeptidase
VFTRQNPARKTFEGILQMNTSEFDDKLAKLAALGVKTGVNLQKGQELLVTAPLEANALVHHLTRTAYQLGAKLVTCLYEDPGMIRDRFDYVEDAALDYAPAWMSRGISEALVDGGARLFVVGPYPDLLTGIPADKILRAHTAAAAASNDESRFTSDSRINWSVLPFVTTSWARMVFPELPAAEALEKLWGAVFDATRISCLDPFGAWQQHTQSLNSRREILQSKRFDALHFHDGRTDLKVGLVDGHRWVGGSTRAANGIEGVCNIPNEEIFTCPHRNRADGRVFFSKPLAVAGTLVDDVCIDFREGLAVSIRAGKGQDVIEKLISSDQASRHLGEIALVPNSSPISASNILFYNALFDENAASHFAFGQSYGACLPPSPRSPEELGANESSIHIDCMFGNSSMNVDGIAANGFVEPIMRDGEFAF